MAVVEATVGTASMAGGSSKGLGLGLGGQAAVTEAGASKDVKVSAERGYLAIGFGLVILGVVLGYFITQSVQPPPFTPVEGIGIFAVFYIFAQALERFMEPVIGLVPAKKKALSERDIAIAEAKTKSTNDNLVKAADAQEQVNQARANMTVLSWGLTSLIAMLGSGYLGMYLLRAVGVAGAPVWLDIAITGLAVGAGTKPLHDLIKNIEKSKEEKEDKPIS